MEATMPLQIAIDGPVAAGKGDIAARLAKKLHLLYVNTGAMYRTLALACINKKVTTKDVPGVLSVLDAVAIDLSAPSETDIRTCIALLDGVDVTDRILDPDVSMGASDVAVIPQVRAFMVKRQQEMAKGNRVVMEGRDIGIRVLPNAPLKIYLTASLETRAKRRLEQWKNKGIQKTYEEVLQDTIDRDKQDSGRKTDPLQKLPDAWELDSTLLTQDQVVEAIIEELKKRSLV